MLSDENNIVVPAALLRAAKVCQAKGDVRYYLNGIHLNREGFVESSDGHIAFRVECEELKTLESSLIVAIQGSIPKTAAQARVVLEADETVGYLQLLDEVGTPLLDRDDIPQRLWLLSIEGKFPELDSVIPTDPQPTTAASFDLDYLYRAKEVAKALGGRYPHARFQFHGKEGPALAEIKGPGHKALLLVMGLRD